MYPDLGRPCIGTHLVHQVCLVTGGARGLGQEFCRAFIQSGCTTLAIVDLKENEAAEAGEELVKQACRADSLSFASVT